MRIAVFVRPVHHPAFPIVPGTTTRLEELPGYEPTVNPRDELALEAALILKGQSPEDCEIVVCSTGGKAAQAVLRECLAYDVQEAVWIQTDCWEPDGLIVARELSDYYRSWPFDLGLFGARDSDTLSGQTGPMFSALTGLPYLDSVVDVQRHGPAKIAVNRRQKRLHQHIHAPFPVCLGILRGQPLRYPSFWGKLKAANATLRPMPAEQRDDRLKVERRKFTRSKPKTTAMASTYGQTKSVDRIRQAVGFINTGAASKGDSLIKGTARETAQKAIELFKKEKLIE